MTTRRRHSQGANTSRRSATTFLNRSRPAPTSNNGATLRTGDTFTENTPIVEATRYNGTKRYFPAATTAFEVRLGMLWRKGQLLPDTELLTREPGIFGEKFRDLPFAVSDYDPYNVTRSRAEYGKHAARNATIVWLQAGYADEHGTYLPLPCPAAYIDPASTWEEVAPRVEGYCTSAMDAVRVATGQGDDIYDSGYETIQG